QLSIHSRRSVFPYTTLFRSSRLTQGYQRTHGQSCDDGVIGPIETNRDMVLFTVVGPILPAQTKIQCQPRSSLEIILKVERVFFLDRKSTRLNSSPEWIAYTD